VDADGWLSTAPYRGISIHERRGGLPRPSCWCPPLQQYRGEKADAASLGCTKDGQLGARGGGLRRSTSMSPVLAGPSPYPVDLDSAVRSRQRFEDIVRPAERFLEEDGEGRWEPPAVLGLRYSGRCAAWTPCSSRLACISPSSYHNADSVLSLDSTLSFLYLSSCTVPPRSGYPLPLCLSFLCVVISRSG